VEIKKCSTAESIGVNAMMEENIPRFETALLGTGKSLNKTHDTIQQPPIVNMLPSENSSLQNSIGEIGLY